jgi:hypothetical protein
MHRSASIRMNCMLLVANELMAQAWRSWRLSSHPYVVQEVKKNIKYCTGCVYEGIKLSELRRTA